MRITLCSLVCACLLVPSAAIGQDGPAIAGNPPLAVADRPTPQKVANSLRSAVLRHAATLGTRLPNPPSRQQPPPHRNWISRNTALFGALVGFGAMAVPVGAICYSEEGGGDIPCSTYTLGYGALGAGIGAGIGFAVSALRR